MARITRDGFTDGLPWIELDGLTAAGVTWHLKARGAENADRVRIVCTDDHPMEKDVRDRLVIKTEGYGYSMRSVIGFRPFDEDVGNDGYKICYYTGSFEKFDVGRWAKNRLEVPESIDLTFDFQPDNARLYAVARTIRNGRETMVKRKVETNVPFRDAMKPILGYFERNCPRPGDGQVEAVTCGGHLNGILAGLSAHGWKRTSEWIEMVRVQRDLEHIAPYFLTSLDLPRTPGIERLELRPAGDSNAIHARVTLKGGHQMIDDGQGTTITLRSELPETIVMALRGKQLSNLVDIPWASELVIRTAKIVPYDDKTRARAHIALRAGSKGQALDLGPQPAHDMAATHEWLSGKVFSAEPTWGRFDESLRPVFEAMSATTLATVLALLNDTDDGVSLEPHGFPGWTVGKASNKIRLVWGPDSPLDDLVRTKIEKERQVAQAS